MTDSELVYQFTKETTGLSETKPSLMTSDEIFFLIKMMLDEIMELAATVESPIIAKYNMIEMIINSKNIEKETGSDTELIASQADALVDCYYYSLNSCAKKGINLSNIFQIVHQANMNKRDLKTGKFIKREDGKIIKPEGWKSPDITSEIEKQIKEGSFN